MKRTRVLVVDDSAFARKVLRELLSREEDLEVVGTARDGLDALEKIAELAPDVVTLDLVMPELDGLGVLRALQGGVRPSVVVVSMSDADSELGVQALELGAVELVHKPTALATERLYELGGELISKVRVAAAAQPRLGAAPVPQPLEVHRAVQGSAPLVVIGTSTGGPRALTHLLSALPASFPSPVAVTLHISLGYTQAVAERLNGLCALEVLEAYDGLELHPGRVVLAHAGMHLKLLRSTHGFTCVLDLAPLHSLHRPSVDVLFASAVEAAGGEVLGVVLTGMGADGTEGAQAIHDAGGRVLTEAESSCVVYGMPRAVVERGLSSGSHPLERMASGMQREVAHWVPGQPRV